MSRIVVDALIKLGKAEVLALLLEDHEVLVPWAVHEEAVVKGKLELYEDAFVLEELLKDGEARILRMEAEQAGALGETRSFLGPGERDALRAYREERADAILSDDRVFLRYLGENSVAYLTPASVVVRLVESERLRPGEGLAALEKFRGHIRGSVYSEAREALERWRGER